MPSAWILTGSDVHGNSHNSCVKNAETRHTLSTTLGEKDVPMSQAESLVGAIPLSIQAAMRKCSALQREEARLKMCPQWWSCITPPPHLQMLEIPELSSLCN